MPAPTRRRPAPLSCLPLSHPDPRRPIPPPPPSTCLQGRALAAEVAELFRAVVALSVKLREATVPSDVANPKQLSELGPSELSFWVASLFAGNPYQVRAAVGLQSCLAGWGRRASSTT